ncbi:MAG: hypothetical protein ACJ739_06625 [Acidimicrobiales bacterium]
MQPTSERLPSFPVDTLTVRPWIDDVIDAVGHEVRSPYVEQFWLGLLGPSSTWLLRRLVARFDAEPDGYQLDLPLTATELGLGARSGRHSPFLRSIERCCRFGAAQQVDATTLRVRRKLPPLTRMQLARLPAALQEAHAAWTDPPVPGLPVEEMRERARGLALSLLELGEGAEATERQLHRWRLHPAIAHEAVAWAIDHRSVTQRVAPGDLPPEAA